MSDELAKSLDNQETIDKNNQDLNLKLDEIESLKRLLSLWSPTPRQQKEVPLKQDKSS